jgi:hypothetical protein
MREAPCHPEGGGIRGGLATKDLWIGQRPCHGRKNAWIVPPAKQSGPQDDKVGGKLDVRMREKGAAGNYDYES